jgi:hypothetical protein
VHSVSIERSCSVIGLHRAVLSLCCMRRGPLLIVQLTCRIETTRHVSSITIVLSTVPLDTSAPGYQAPLPEDQVKEHVPSAVTSPTAGTVEPPRGMRARSFVLIHRGLRHRPADPCAPLRLVR